MSASSGPTKEKDFEDGASVKACGICKAAFGVTKWRHNCRWCGEVVCDDCSTARIALPPMYPSEVRVCDLCKVPATTYAAKGGPRRLGTAAEAAVPSSSAAATSAPATASGAANSDAEREKRAAALAARLGRGAGAGSAASRGRGAGGGGGGMVAPNATFASAEEEEAERRRQREVRQRIYERDMAKERQEKEAATASAAAQPSRPAEAPASTVEVSAEAPPEPSGSNSVAEPEQPSVAPTPAPAAAASRAPAPGSNPMLEAALRRQAAAKGRSNATPASAASVDPERTALLARISQALAQRRQDEPFGLRSMETPKLRVYLRHLEDS